MNERQLKRIISEEIKKALQEGNEEQVTDTQASEKGLRKLTALPNTQAALKAPAEDLSKLSGETKYNAIAWMLSQMGVKDTDLSVVTQKLKAATAAQTTPAAAAQPPTR